MVNKLFWRSIVISLETLDNERPGLSGHTLNSEVVITCEMEKEKKAWKVLLNESYE